MLMWSVTIPIPGGVRYGNAGELEPAKAAFRKAWLKFKAAAGSERLARAIETQDNAQQGQSLSVASLRRAYPPARAAAARDAEGCRRLHHQTSESRA